MVKAGGARRRERSAGGPSARRAVPRSSLRLAALCWLALGCLVSASLHAADLDHSVGRIASGAEEVGRCTAVFFEADRALTAGHCVANKSKWQPAAADSLKVILAGRRLTILQIKVSPNSPFNANGQIADLRNDWAVLTLKVVEGDQVQPLPYGGAAPARAAYVSDDRIVKAGIEGQVLRQTAECQVTEMESQAHLFLFRCPEGMGAGASGSALLARRGAGFAILGIQSARVGDGPLTKGVAVVPPETALER
jgi:hypothetical protein